MSSYMIPYMIIYDTIFPGMLFAGDEFHYSWTNAWANRLPLISENIAKHRGLASKYARSKHTVLRVQFSTIQALYHTAKNNV